jgi:hypothetical protein
MRDKKFTIKYEAIPATQEQLDDIFFFVLNKIEEKEVLDNSKELSDTYNSNSEGE